MASKEVIEHQGVISRVSDQTYLISLENTSACGSCQAKGYCYVSENDPKVVEVQHTGQDFKEGEPVIVMLDHSLGIQAMVLGYILPFFLVFGILVVALSITGREGLSGLIAIASLVPYYLVLYFLRFSLKNKFSFTIKAIH